MVNNKLRRDTKRYPGSHTIDRILIISEGAKTEPNYFNEIRRFYRSTNAVISIYSSKPYADPVSAVAYAERLLVKGDSQKGIKPKSFEQVYVVFDHDGRDSIYLEAIDKARTLKKEFSKIKKPIKFEVVPSIPSFELWFLLHFKNILAPLNNTEVLQLLRNYLPKYEKNMKNMFELTQEHLSIAYERAEKLATSNSYLDGSGPCTEAYVIVKLLTSF